MKGASFRGAKAGGFRPSLQKGKKGGSFYMSRSGNKVYRHDVPNLRQGAASKLVSKSKGFASKLAAKFKARKMPAGVPDLRPQGMAHTLARGVKAAGRVGAKAGGLAGKAGKGIASRLLAAGKKQWEAHKSRQAETNARVKARLEAPHQAQSMALQKRAMQLMTKGDTKGAMAAMVQAKQASYLHEAHQAMRTGDIDSAMKALMHAEQYPQRLARRMRSGEEEGGAAPQKSSGEAKSSGSKGPPPIPDEAKKKKDGVHTMGPRGGVYHEAEGKRRLVRARRASAPN